MANLKEVRTRIASVDSTKQITNAMRMVSASKLRKSQNLILNLRPYAFTLRDLLENLGNYIETPYHEVRPLKNIRLIVVTSNKGLCGAFSSNIIKTTQQRIAEIREKNSDCNIELITIGKHGTEFFRKINFPIAASYDDIFEELTFENTSAIAERLIDDFLKKRVDRIECIYNQFKNASVQLLRDEPFLPLVIAEHTEKSQAEINYIFQPSKEDIVRELIPKNLKTQLYRVVLSSFTSEHGARMTTMHKATDNATELLKELKLSYNKARQASITNEIIEISGSAEAL